MKYNKIILAAILGLGLSACSLDREPQDPNTNTVFNQDEVFSKCYATFGTTGQKGPDGSGDVDGIDEGTSGFYRMFFSLNEFPTDDGWWIWSTDAGVADLLPMTWSKSNTFITGLYYRFYFDITMCNHFLDRTEGASDDKTVTQRAEVRMIRAINYYFLLDMFNGAPMPLTVSPEKPAYTSRADMFAWLEKECLDLARKLPAAGQRHSKYQVDQACAWFILMRMYLNAAVYLGEPGTPNYDKARWNDAAIYADSLIRSPYQLYNAEAAVRNEDHVYYSAYQQLFMGDNDQTAKDEAILLIYQDANYCQSWAGARFLVNAFRDADFVPNGSSDSWTCFRSSPELVTKFVTKEAASDIKLNEFQMPVRLKDDRAIFCSVSTADKAFKLSGGQASDLYASWACPKFTGIYATSTDPWNWTSPVGIPDWVDTDIPLFRVAEAYLTYAECMQRGAAVPAGAKYTTMMEPIKALRDRAHATEKNSMSYTELLDEWAREFWCEGRRRTDLIRFEQFAGPKASLTWEGHNGTYDAKYNVFPIPESDETANPNLAGVNAKIGY